MAGRIPQNFIDELMQRADIVEVIGSRVQLKKAGREYKACCPFHGEKTPSFTVSPSKGFYHCFGCGAHGTALGFLMEHDRLEFVTAVEELASMYGLEVPREHAEAPGGAPLAPLLDLLRQAAEFFRSALREHPAAIEYLRGRGVDGETAKAFGLGYAPPAWDALLRRFGTDDAARDQLLAAGLTIARDGGGYYDRFRDRIMFPIRDSRGRVVGFGGRVLGAGEPKYLNSPETALFHKGKELYGLYESREAERRPARLLVVEGYMDVVSLARHGVHNAVATLGTATTPEHVRRVFRLVPEVVFCFDGDRAGRSAAWKALQTTLPELREGRQARFLFLPDGDDPDTLVAREGADAFRARVEGAMPLSAYLLEELERQAGPESLDARARLAELARPLLAQIQPGVYRELLLQQLSQRVGLRQDRLAAALGEGAPAEPARLRGPARRPVRSPTGRPSLIRRAIQLLLHFPAIAARCTAPAGLARVDRRGIRLLLGLLELGQAHPGLTPGAVLERFRDRPEAPHLQELLAEDTLVGEDGAARELADSLQRILEQDRDDRLAVLVAKADAGPLSTEEKEELRSLQRGATAQSARL